MKRFFDIIVSFIGLVIFAPILVVLALVVSLSSKGGSFYLQKRVGKGSRDFLLIKFRTMHQDSDKKGLITIGGRDPRVTKVGFFLRKYKLDELPQLLNVLKGDMSLVGPRPEVRKYVDMYSEQHLQVLSVRPGITDYASIEFSDENELLGKAENPNRLYIEEIMPKKLKLNLRYIDEMSFFTDIKIIVKTILKIISR